MTKPLFITSLEESGGKTLVTLGIVGEFSETFDNVGFIKPVGVARARAGHEGIDLDAMLVEKLHAVHENIKDMCPVTLGPTQWPVVNDGESSRMLERIRDAYDRISEGRDVVVVEGSGGATLGNCFGLSNARIAESLGCRALLVVSYGAMAENPFDRVLLHRDHFAAAGVDTVGIVINKIPADILDSYRPYAASQLERLGTELLGAIPADPRLQTFRFLQVTEHLEGEMLANAAQAERTVHRVRIGATTPHRALPHFGPGVLVITPGDRDDMIVTVCAAASAMGKSVSGLVLSAGIRPNDAIVDLIERSGIPTFLAEEDSFTCASKIHDMPLRIQPTDEEKIAAARGLVVDHVNIDRILEQL